MSVLLDMHNFYLVKSMLFLLCTDKYDRGERSSLKLELELNHDLSFHAEQHLTEHIYDDGDDWWMKELLIVEEGYATVLRKNIRMGKCSVFERFGPVMLHQDFANEVFSSEIEVHIFGNSKAFYF